MPLYFLADDRPEFQHWLKARGLHEPWEALRAGEEPSGPPKSKWPKERKPTVELAMRFMAPLRRASFALGEPIYIIGDDAKDYFNQLPVAIPELWKLGVVFLAESSDHEDAQAGDLVFISEKRLGFGTHGASNTAQRFSNAILEMFRDNMDEAEAAARTAG